MKKIISLALAMIFVLSLMACSDEKAEENSSKTENEATSSVASMAETSSKKGFNRDETASETASSSVTVPGVDPTKTRQINGYQLNPSWAKYFGTTDEAIYKELDMVFSNGYFNSIITGYTHLANPKFWEVVEKHNLTIWIHHAMRYYESEEQSVKEFVSDIDYYLSLVKKNPDRWNRIMGFHYEENVWRGQKPEDYLAETKYLYQTYGKRNWAVYATGEFLGIEGNEVITGDSADSSLKLTTECLAYTTDISFDAYAVDVREGTDYSNNLAKWKEKISPNVTDGKSYYTETLAQLKKLTGHDAYVWVFPTAYTCYLACGLNGIKYADEGYCVGHLKFFKEILDKEKFQGGISLFNYPKGSKSETHYIQEFLDIRDENGKNVIYPEFKKWTEYSKLLKEITAEFRASETKTLPGL